MNDENYGIEIIKDVLSGIDDKTKEKLMKWLENESKVDALQIGFDYNTVKGTDNIPTCVLDEQFGHGYICAIRHITNIIMKTD